MRILLVPALALCVASPAISQDIITDGVHTKSTVTPTPTAITTIPADQLNLGEIIVTATRLYQDKQTYPAKIDVLSSERLAELSGVHAAEALNSVPGVHIHRGSGLEHLTSIRSPVLTGGAGAGSFLYLQDGIPLRAAGFANVNGLLEAQMELVERTEVFKGPGSVLHGSNALHGLVNVISREPDGKNRYQILGSEDGHVSGAFSHSGENYIVNAALAHDDGFREASGYDQQKVSFRSEHTGNDWDANFNIAYQNLNQETAGFVQGDEAYKDDPVRFSNPNPEAYRDSQSLRAHARLAKDLGEDMQLVVMPYARWIDMEFLRHFVPGQATEKVGHWSVGALNTYYGKNFLLGFDAEYTKGFLKEFQTGPSVFSFVQGEHYNYDVEAITLAGYGEYDFPLGPNTELSIGARAEYVDYAYDNKIDTADVGRFRRVDDRSDDFFVMTPKLALSHELSENINVYARAVRGARAPQVSDLYSLQTQQVPGEIKSETLDSLEVGLKVRTNKLSFEAAAYIMEKDNFFFRNSNGLNVINGKTSHQGLEASANWKPVEFLEISGNLNLASHDYNFTDIGNSPSASITRGDAVDTAPDIFGHFAVKVRPTANLQAELEWRHMGKYALDSGNTAFYPGHDVIIMRAQYSISEAAVLFGRIDNLLDTKYADRADYAFGGERYFPGRPRTLFWGIRGEF